MDHSAGIELLFQNISKRVPLEPQDKMHFKDLFKLQKFDKKSFLFNQGKSGEWNGFVLTGTWRVFHCDDKGSEHVLYFAFPDWWLGDMTINGSENTAFYSAQTLEDSYLMIINKEQKEQLLMQVPALERFFRIITERHLAVLQKRFLLTISTNAVERYKELIQRSPGIEQLVPQHQIASYLGILPESLSRMKKQLNSKD
jgi:CRP-like cAMP-binding protein